MTSNPTDTNNEELRSDESLMAKIEYLLDTGYTTDMFDFIKARDQQIALAAQSKGWVNGSIYALEELINNAAYAGRKTVSVKSITERLAMLKAQEKS